MEELRSILVDLQFKLNSIVNRIPLAQHPGTPGRDGNSAYSAASDRSQSFSHSPTSARSNEGFLPGGGPNGCPEQYHTPVLVAFHKWARILLSLFVDKVSPNWLRLQIAKLTSSILGILCRLPAFLEERQKPHMACCETRVSRLHFGIYDRC
jgi:hypothetical protein